MDGVETNSLSGHMEILTEDNDGDRHGESIERRVLEALVEPVVINGDRYLLRAFRLQVNTNDGVSPPRTAEAIYVPVLGAAVRGTVPEQDPTVEVAAPEPTLTTRSALEAALAGSGGPASSQTAPQPASEPQVQPEVQPTGPARGGSTPAAPSFRGGPPSPVLQPGPALPGATTTNRIVPGISDPPATSTASRDATTSRALSSGMRFPAPPPKPPDDGPQGPIRWQFVDIQVSDSVLSMVQQAALR